MFAKIAKREESRQLVHFKKTLPMRDKIVTVGRMGWEGNWKRTAIWENWWRRREGIKKTEDHPW